MYPHTHSHTIYLVNFHHHYYYYLTTTTNDYIL